MSTDAALDPAAPYELAPSVSVRPEPFGALVYDFVTRRLSFLKSPLLVSVVDQLDRRPDVAATLDAAGVPASQRPRYLDALADLAATGMIRRREQENVS